MGVIKDTFEETTYKMKSQQQKKKKKKSQKMKGRESPRKDGWKNYLSKLEKQSNEDTQGGGSPSLEERCKADERAISIVLSRGLPWLPAGLDLGAAWTPSVCLGQPMPEEEEDGF